MPARAETGDCDRGKARLRSYARTTSTKVAGRGATRGAKRLETCQHPTPRLPVASMATKKPKPARAQEPKATGSTQDASTGTATAGPEKKPRKPHPRTRPLPADPIEAKRMLARREVVKRSVIQWRRNHPHRALALFRHCVRLQRFRHRARTTLALATAH